jgi:hypothetical protein
MNTDAMKVTLSVIARSVLCDEAISIRDQDCFAKNARNDGVVE